MGTNKTGERKSKVDFQVVMDISDGRIKAFLPSEEHEGVPLRYSSAKRYADRNKKFLRCSDAVLLKLRRREALQ